MIINTIHKGVSIFIHAVHLLKFFNAFVFLIVIQRKALSKTSVKIKKYILKKKKVGGRGGPWSVVCLLGN